MDYRNFIKVLLLLLIALIDATPSMSQPVQNPLPLEFTSDGVTLRITKAGFFQGAQAVEGLNADSSFANWILDGRKSFLVRYEVQRTTPLKNAMSDLNRGDLSIASTQDNMSILRARDAATTLSLYSPSGEPLLPVGGGSKAGGNQQLQWLSVDPSWKHVTADFLVLDPAAPLSASGLDEQVLAFENLPFPKHQAQPLPIKQTLTANYGTEITLEHISVRHETTAEGKPGQKVDLQLSWQRPDDVPDLKAELEFDGIGEGKQTAIALSDWGSQGPSFNLSIPLERPLKDMYIRIKVRERAPSKRQMQWCRRFRCELKLPGINIMAPVNPARMQVVQAGDKDGVVGMLEDLMSAGEETRLHSMLWLRNAATIPPATLPHPTGAVREWSLEGLRIRDQDNKEIKSWWTTRQFTRGINESQPIHWRIDGTPTLPGEIGYPLYIDWAKGRTPDPMSFEATVAPVFHQHNVFELKNIPVPGIKERLDLNTEGVPVAPDVKTRVILRRVMRIRDARDFKDIGNWQRQSLRVGGLALLFQVIPGQKNSQAKFDISIAEDEAARSVLEPNATVVAQGNLLPVTATTPTLRDEASGQWWTVCLAPPIPTAKELRLQIVTDETWSGGQTRTLLFKNVRNQFPAK